MPKDPPAETLRPAPKDLSKDWTSFEPQERIGLLADDPLIDFLRANRGSPVRVSLRTQRRTDSRVLQTLLTAAKTWAADGAGFEVTDVPRKLGEDFVRLGLEAQTIGWSGLK